MFNPLTLSTNHSFDQSTILLENLTNIKLPTDPSWSFGKKALSILSSPFTISSHRTLSKIKINTTTPSQVPLQYKQQLFISSNFTIEECGKSIKEAEYSGDKNCLIKTLIHLSFAFSKLKKWSQAAQILNCALALTEKKLDVDSALKADILQFMVQLKKQFLLTEYSKNLDFSPDSIILNRTQLQETRQGISKGIESHLEIKTILNEFSLAIVDFLNEIHSQVIQVLGLPPCEYALISLGSLARNEMSAYSDLEFAILLKKNQTTR